MSIIKSFGIFLAERDITIPNIENIENRKRHKMPQIVADDIPHLLKWLLKRGITNKEIFVDPLTLSPTQSEFNVGKIKFKVESINDGGVQKPSLVSRDLKIIDGHHGWLASVDLKIKTSVIIIDLDIDDALKQLKKYPRSFSKGINE